MGIQKHFFYAAASKSRFKFSTKKTQLFFWYLAFEGEMFWYLDLFPSYPFLDLLRKPAALLFSDVALFLGNNDTKKTK